MSKCQKLIISAAKAVAPTNLYDGTDDPTEQEVEDMNVSVEALNPKDHIEYLYATQAVVAHYLGMHKMSSTHTDDVKLATKLLNLSSGSLYQLDKKQKEELPCH